MALLLSRKSSWGPPDLARFTDVYQAEHESEGGVAAAKARCGGATPAAAVRTGSCRYACIAAVAAAETPV